MGNVWTSFRSKLPSLYFPHFRFPRLPWLALFFIHAGISLVCPESGIVSIAVRRISHLLAILGLCPCVKGER